MYMLVSFLLLIIGIAMLVIWIADINNNPEIDFSKGFFKARGKASGELFCFHIIGEVLTGIMLILSGIIILYRTPEWMPCAYFSLGALFYTSLNSLGWAFARKERKRYGIPITAGLIISIFSFIILLLN
ncbi:MAG: hypothetical protein JRJ57_08950 [Deltaproteobacteria bacterium]|nr:hypothetical protein [Deltaproteobacteria bacterium]